MKKNNIQAIANQVGCEFDGGDDRRIHAETLHVPTLRLSAEEYAAMEADINGYEKHGQGFTVYAWNDCSGYKYWTVQQRENNYIQVTAIIDEEAEVDVPALRKAVREAQEYFGSRYGRDE
jgi:hypothetical protein